MPIKKQPSKPIARTVKLPKPVMNIYSKKDNVPPPAPTLTKKPVGSSTPPEQGQR